MKGRDKWAKWSVASIIVIYACIFENEMTAAIINGHEYVDLGLSVKWATCNVGASSPSDYGSYFAWGETTTKSSYTERNSTTYGRSIGDIMWNSRYDAARTNWGDSWRLPTAGEICELVDKCQWKWTTQGGHNGYQVTGPNGNSIFLPAAGWCDVVSLSRVGEYGGYWGSSPLEDEGNLGCAYSLFFGNDIFGLSYSSRSYGKSVRPVYSDSEVEALIRMAKEAVTAATEANKTSGTINGHEYVNLGLSVKWATCNVGASSPSDYGSYFAWGEITTKYSYSLSNSAWYGKSVTKSTIKGSTSFDAARANWGGTWRLPTASEINELVNKCQWKWTTQGGHNGYQVTGPNGKSIFVPAAGYYYVSTLLNAGEIGYYWSSSPHESNTSNAYLLYFTSGYFTLHNDNRCHGWSVRPVSE